MKRNRQSTEYYHKKIAEILLVLAHQNDLDMDTYSIDCNFSRPFSEVFRVGLNLKNKQSYGLYIKFYVGDNTGNSLAKRVERDYQTTQFWYDKFADSDQFNVIRPIYCDPEMQVLISEESPGLVLFDFMHKHGRYFPGQQTRSMLADKISAVGEWLKFFHTIKVDRTEEPITLQYFQTYFEKRLNWMEENRHTAMDSRMRGQVEELLIRLWQQIEAKGEQSQISYQHSDLSLSNVLVNGSTVTVLDFAEKKTGSPYKDVARLYHQLDLLAYKPAFRKPVLDALKAAFLRGYGREEIDCQPFFKLFLLIHTINHLNKAARYWQHSFAENIYNRWLVLNSEKKLRKMIVSEH